jgi:myo-inositol-1(or 4)-monophosphatase
MIRSALMNVMTAAALKAGRGLKRDFGEVENLQVSVKGPGDFRHRRRPQGRKDRL